MPAQSLKGINMFNKERILFWLPRVLAILFIVFLALFALDVFVPGESILYMIGGFLVHLIPDYLLIAALIIAWKRERIGGVLFILLGLGFTIFFRTYSALSNFLIVSFPVFLIGTFFLCHKYLVIRM